MSLKEIQDAVSNLPQEDFRTFCGWFDEFRADAWDKQIEEDARSGRLNAAVSRADADFEAGRCTPLFPKL